MKKTFLYYIKLTVAFLLFLQVGEVSAQWSGSYSIYASPLACLPANSNWIGGGLGYPTASTPIAATATYTFATPVSGFKILLGAFDAGPGISGISITEIKINGVHYNVTSSNLSACTSPSVPVADANGYIRSNAAATNAQQVAGYVTIYPGYDVTSFSVGTNDNNGMFVQSAVTSFVCNAGYIAPTLSSTNITNPCPTATFNLNSLVTSATPSGASLKWYTDAARTTEVTTPTAVATSGTYYAFYVDTVNNCYSPASGAVTATVTVCPVNISNTCPASSVDLALSLASTNVVPSGYTLTYHSGTPATTANKLTSSVVTTAGTYYGAYYLSGQDCYTATGRPLVVTITDCCAAKIAPDLTN